MKTVPVKRLLIAASITALGLAPALQAAAQSSRLYFAGYLGLNTFSNQGYDNVAGGGGEVSIDNAPMLAGALGVRLDRQARIEAEVSYRNAPFGRIAAGNGANGDLGGQIKTWALMLNGYYDFDFEWDHIQPFVTVGLGVAHHEGEIDDVSGITGDASGRSLNLAWQAGTGLKYRVRDDLAFTGGYRYFGTTDLGLKDASIEYSSHEFRLGLEYDLDFR